MKLTDPKQRHAQRMIERLERRAKRIRFDDREVVRVGRLQVMANGMFVPGQGRRVRPSKYMPHNGVKEKARRVRQMQGAA